MHDSAAPQSAAKPRSELFPWLGWACAMAVGALALGALLVPKGDELLLIHVKNHDVARARQVLADGQGASVSSAASAIAHGELFLFEGRVDEAIDEMEAYAAARPDDQAAWIRLAELYQNAQRLHDWQQTLAHVYKLAPTEARARELAATYRRSGDEAAEARVLRDLATTAQAQPDELLRSARLEAAFGNRDRARATLEQLRRLDSSHFDYPAIEFYASLTADAGRADELAHALQPLPLVREEPHLLVDLAAVFKGWGNIDAALAVLKPLPGLPALPVWLAALARTASGTEHASRVVRQLTALDATNPLSSEPLDALVTLAISTADEDAVDRLLANHQEHLEPAIIARVVGHAAAAGNRDRAQALVARFGDAGLSETPILALELAAQRGDVAAADRWIAFIDAAGNAAPEELAAVAQAELSLGREARAYDRLAGVAATGRAPDWALTDLTTAALRVGRVEDALRLLTPLARSSSGARAAWARLAAATGRVDLVAGWFASTKANAADAAALRDVYYALADHGDHALATEAARRLFGVTGRADDAVRYGQALLASGKPLDALASLRPMRTSSADAAAAYDSALHAAHAAGHDVAVELRITFTARLHEANLSDARRAMVVEGLWLAGERASIYDEILRLSRQDLPRWLPSLVEAAKAKGDPDPVIAMIVPALDALDARPAPGTSAAANAAAGPDPREALTRALVDLDAPDRLVLPRLRALATDRGGSWAFAYDERLAQSGRTADRIALWTAIGQSATASADERRGAASRLHELGDAGTAAAVIQPLATAAAPSDPDVDALLYYWGSHPTPDQRAWLIARLLAAPAADQPAWMTRLVAAGGSRDVMTAVPALPSSASPALIQVWLDASRATTDRSLLRSSLDSVIARRGVDVESLRHAGRIALGDSLNDTAERAFRAVAAARPDDLEALRWAGMLSFYEGRTNDARTWLNAYLRSGGDDPEPLYQLGELSRQSRDAILARQYYARALDRLNGPSGADANPGLRPNVLARLGKRQDAMVAFDALLVSKPELDHVRADYVADLLEWGEHGRAGLVLLEAPVQPAGAAAGDARPSADDGGKKRLDLLRVQWLVYGGQYGQALQILDALGARYPTDPDVLVARGRFDADRGWADAADRSFTAARLEAPGREDIVALVDGRRRAAAPRVLGNTEFRSVPGAWDERMTSASFAGLLAPHRTFTLTLQQIQLSAARLLLGDGQDHPVSATRQRLEATVTTPVADGTTVSAAFFAASGGAGASARIARDDLRGSLAVTAEFGRPYWEFPVSVADDGERDRVGIERQLRFGADTAAWALVNWNRYRLESGPSLSTGGVTAGVVRLVRRDNPALTLQYGFDLEKRFSATLVTTPDGHVVSPIPLSDREVHVVGIVSRFPAAVWDAEVAAGYALDRLGGRGPFFTVHLRPDAGARAGVEIWAERRLYALATTQQELRAGVALTVRLWK